GTGRAHETGPAGRQPTPSLQRSSPRLADETEASSPSRSASTRRSMNRYRPWEKLWYLDYRLESGSK
ncbi:hypothetical protein KXW37_006193, partial [Aspergillus fumigatus]